MSVLDPFAEMPAPVPGKDEGVTPLRAADLGDRLGTWLNALSDRLNPILVKEARQALKSQQFLATFAFLLLFGWGWSAIGIVLMLPGVYYLPGGPFLLSGYYVILAVPLLLIVPFATYRSLAAEREDGTFELLSITSLSSRQIVTGKLGSAVLQMLVYYSALAPCIAFTYLLRGVDLPTILALLAYTFLASLLLSIIGLLLATATRARHWQLLISVLFLLSLAFAGFFWTLSFIMMLSEQVVMPFDAPEFWLSNLALIMFYVSYAALFIAAAAGMLSFASDNRSTRLRIIMLIQQLLLVGWMTYVWIESAVHYPLIGLFIIGAIHWSVMGAMLCGEVAQLSPRVRRSLPQSFLGRMLFTWFNPGSGTGYVFTVLNLLALWGFVAIALLIGSAAGFGGVDKEYEVLTFGALCCAYPAAYLGVTRPLIRLLQPYTRAGLLLPLLINAFVAAVGCLIPLVIEGWLRDFGMIEYTGLQMTNWFWTLAEAVEGRVDMVLWVTILAFATIVFLGNLLLACREVQAVRLATPARVLRDDVPPPPVAGVSAPREAS